MEETPEFPVLLWLIGERPIAFRAAVASAPSLDVQVPTCPEWTLLDLAQHLGEVHRFWAAAVEAGPAAARPAESASQRGEPAPREREALPAWSAASTRQLPDALREAGPDRGCRTRWGPSESPQTSDAVARHQLQEVAVHTYDAQITPGAPRPLPDGAALDGVDEFRGCSRQGDPVSPRPDGSARIRDCPAPAKSRTPGFEVAGMSWCSMLRAVPVRPSSVAESDVDGAQRFEGRVDPSAHDRWS